MMCTPALSSSLSAIDHLLLAYILRWPPPTTAQLPVSELVCCEVSAARSIYLLPATYISSKRLDADPSILPASFSSRPSALHHPIYRPTGHLPVAGVKCQAMES